MLKEKEGKVDFDANMGNLKMKKSKNLFLGLILSASVLTGCTEADKVSYNLSKEADNFNDIRQITVINCLKGDVLFQMTGKMSIYVDESENQLEVTVEDENKEYKKHFIGLSDNVTYVIEDITADDVNNYKYTLLFNPDMIIPYEVENSK